MKKKNYKSPDVEVIVLKTQSVLCQSPGGSDPLNPGGGI